VLFLGEIAQRLTERLRTLGREDWVVEDCLALEDPRLYEPDPAQAWKRLRGLKSLPPGPRACARVLAAWRERLARERDLPRGWIISDAAILALAEVRPTTRAALADVPALPSSLSGGIAESLLEALRDASNVELDDLEPEQDARPTAEQKAVIDRLARLVDAHAAALGVSGEILAPRGELKALAMGEHNVPALTGWRRSEIGEKLLAAI
jgi:ribonuclease D